MIKMRASNVKCKKKKLVKICLSVFVSLITVSKFSQFLAQIN